MDTRTKIVDSGYRDLSGAFVTGIFDPVTVDHARRLREIHRQYGRVIVLLSDPPDPILDARARAELLAALDAVDFVVLPVGQSFTPQPGQVPFDERAADQTRFQRLVDHIHRRSGSPVAH